MDLLHVLVNNTHCTSTVHTVLWLAASTDAESSVVFAISALIKGTVWHEIFEIVFFYQTTPLGSIRGSLEPF